MKKINFLMLFALVFLLFSCREESLMTNSDSDILKNISTENIHSRFSASSFISSETLKKQLKSSEIKSSFENNARQFKDNSFSKSQFADILIYERVDDLQKNTTTYSLPLVEYSSKNPYFLKHVITVKNNIENEGFIKIIPNSPPVTGTEVLNNFSGIIQILDKDMKISGQLTYLNGSPQNGNPSTATASKIECHDVIQLITHTCTNGGHHLPGQTCDEGLVNNAYYELITTVVCKEEEHLAPLEPVLTSGNGGGGPTMIYSILNHPNFLHTSYLSQGDKMDLLNMVSNWVIANNTSGSTTVDNTVITQLNQMVGIFVNNDQLFSDFATLQDLFDNDNFYLQGTGSYFDTRIKNLIQYLFENPTQENADFVSWATQFFINNTTPNGVCSVSWLEFQRWFIQGYESGYRDKLSLLSTEEVTELVNINKEIDLSPYEEEVVKETNAAFVAFTSYNDVESMTDAQIEYVLNQCCPSVIVVPQYVAYEKTKMIIANYQFNRKFYPEWSKAKCFWEASRETIQLLLDLGGLVPVVGEVCDLTNAAIYYHIGDNLNGSLSLASSVPVVGWLGTGTKMGVKVVNKSASDIASRQVLKWVLGTDGLIKFGYSNQLRKVLKLTDASLQAHHIIPWAYKVQIHPVVQKAAKSSNAFHLNEALNGIPIAKWRNQPNHPEYTNKIWDKLEAYRMSKPNATPEECYNKLLEILNQAKQAIINNPNTHLNNLVF